MFGIVGVLMALPVAQVIQCIFSLLALVLDKVFHKSDDDLDFSACLVTKYNPILMIEHKKKENADEVFDQIANFCKENNLHELTAKRIYLIVEECIYLISKYQDDDISKNKIDAKIIINKDEVLIRFRDNFPKMMTQSVFKTTVGVNLNDIEDNFRRILSLKLIYNFSYNIEHEYIITFNNFLFTIHDLDEKGLEENIQKYKLSLLRSGSVNSS